MAWVYMLRGTTGRFYIGVTQNLDARIARHNTGMVHSTKRMGLPLELVASREFTSIAEAYAMEKKLKAWKNPSKSLEYFCGSSSPDVSGLLVGSNPTGPTFSDQSCFQKVF